MLRIRGGRTWGAVAVIATTLSLTGGVAHASSLAFVKVDNGYGLKGAFAVYTADPGETNNVVVSWDPATGTFKLTDYGVTAVLPDLEVETLLKGDIAPTLANAVPTLTSCVFLLKSVTCRAPGANYRTAFVKLADGNDRAFIGGFDGHIAIGGDAGADTFDAAGGTETVLAGGPGDDIIDGGSGRDDLFGGPGADRLRGGAGLDREVFRHDVPSTYPSSWEADNATTGVNVSLDGVANDGQPGEGDNTASDIETIVGTWFDDTITGSAEPNTLDGSFGNDTIDGREGADRLLGDLGNDALTGGAGEDAVYGDGKFRSGPPAVIPDDDTLNLNDGEADRYNCRYGDDAAHVDGFDMFEFTSQIVANDCEFVGP